MKTSRNKTGRESVGAIPIRIKSLWCSKGIEWRSRRRDAPKIVGGGNDGIANGPTQQSTDTTKSADSKQGDNEIVNHEISQEKAEIIQQSNESEIIVDNAPVTVPTIGNADHDDGDSI